MKIRLLGDEVAPCGQRGRRTDGHGEAHSYFKQFCERT